MNLVLQPLISSMSAMGLHVAHRKNITCQMAFIGHMHGNFKYVTFMIPHRVDDEEGMMHNDEGYNDFLGRAEVFAENHPWEDPQGRGIVKAWL